MRRLATLVTVITAGLGLSSCGQGQAPTAPSGATVFSQNCQVCHSLIGNESLHKVGGDLVGYRMSREALASFTREMPTHHRLSRGELRAVVDYVLKAERSSR